MLVRRRAIVQGAERERSRGRGLGGSPAAAGLRVGVVSPLRGDGSPVPGLEFDSGWNSGGSAASVLILLTRYRGWWTRGRIARPGMAAPRPDHEASSRADVAHVGVTESCDDRTHRSLNCGVGKVGCPAPDHVQGLRRVARVRRPLRWKVGASGASDRGDQGVEDLQPLAAVKLDSIRSAPDFRRRCLQTIREPPRRAHRTASGDRAACS